MLHKQAKLAAFPHGHCVTPSSNAVAGSGTEANRKTDLTQGAVEQRTFNPLVAGSNPARPTRNSVVKRKGYEKS
jgi:hypothetical protein